MPPTFDSILGQDKAIASIRHAYRSDRLPHGFVFAGPVGVGKATTARALGALFLCGQPKIGPDDARPCGTCGSCKLFTADSSSHPDYHVVTKELIRYHDKTGKSKGIDLSINVIRPEVIDRAGIKPAMNCGKVFVIEQAELMNPQAQNALLKTLEEPPGRTLIILLTDQPGLLLPTVASRTQLIRFAPLSDEMVRELLGNRGINKADAMRAASIAGGSLGCALRWLEDGVIDAADALRQRLDRLVQTGKADDLADFLRKAADAYAERQLARDPLASKDQFTREGLLLFLRFAADHFRVKLAQTDDADDLEHFCNAIDTIVTSEQYLDANVSVALALQNLSTALARRFDSISTR